MEKDRPLESDTRYNTGAHLGFLEERSPNFRERANQYKTKKKQI